MKKILAVLGICILLAIMPTMSAVSHQKVDTIETQMPTDTPPEWATGNFTGEWGLSVLGVPFVPLGWIEGYYAQSGILGRYEGYFAEFNVTNATGKIAGFMLGPFMIGGVQDIATGNGTWFVGIGGVNETQQFYWRLTGILGPNFYIYGTYTEFE